MKKEALESTSTGKISRRGRGRLTEVILYDLRWWNGGIPYTELIKITGDLGLWRYEHVCCLARHMMMMYDFVHTFAQLLSALR